MPICKNCNKSFPNRMIIDGKERVLNRRKFCLECSPFGFHNTSPTLAYKRKTKPTCRNCGNTLNHSRSKYCSNLCQKEYQYKEFISKWKSGLIDGGVGNWGKVSKHIRRYLMEKFESKCAKCGWGEINPYTGTVPLEIEHIDGDATNHKEENLTLICPNCHSLTPFYRGANRGNGRGITWIPSSKLKRIKA